MKIIIKQNNIFENKGKTKQQIMKIEDKMPQTKNKFKSFFLWVKLNETFYKFKISWFYSLKDFKKWLRESLLVLDLEDFVKVNLLQCELIKEVKNV